VPSQELLPLHEHYRAEINTDLDVPGATYRRLSDADRARVFRHAVELVGDWGVEVGGEIVATGGFLLHYNPPFADLFMEVAEPHRGRGYGSFLVQELKRTCREMGRVPAARCNADNAASRATLQKAGMMPCARMLTGTLRSRGGGRLSPASSER
jgi:GNAT superfamily N-acetyltransferase